MWTARSFALAALAAVSASAAVTPTPFALNLQPAAPLDRQAYRNSSMWSWGGSVIEVPSSVDPEYRWHLYASGFVEGCGLDAWEANSAALHAVSNVSAAGPFAFSDFALPTYQHNVAPMLLSDNGTTVFLIWTIGMSPEGRVVNCSGGHLERAEGNYPAPLTHGAELVELHYATSPYGPWTALPNATGGLNLFSGTNPSAWFNASSGAMYVASHSGSNMTISTAPHWRGPYSAPVPIFPLVSDGYTAEDPFLWFDEAAQLWRMLFHMYNVSDPHSQVRVGGYAQSLTPDPLGPWWVQPNEQPVYNTTVPLSDGTTLQLSRRERPHLLFSTAADGSRYPSMLLNGVCPADSGNDCWTLAQPIGQ